MKLRRLGAWVLIALAALVIAVVIMHPHKHPFLGILIACLNLSMGLDGLR